MQTVDAWTFHAGQGTAASRGRLLGFGNGVGVMAPWPPTAAGEALFVVGVREAEAETAGTGEADAVDPGVAGVVRFAVGAALLVAATVELEVPATWGQTT